VTEYLDLEDLLAAAQAALGTRPVVRDLGILEAAAARPRSTAFSEEVYRDVHTKAAALLHSIVTGHPLADGNKRLGWVATRLFYRLNGLDVNAPEEPAFELVVGIASGDVRDVDAIAGVLRPWVAPLGE
jgi:death-on-curing protein